jgi:flagellar protein FlaF
MLEGQVLLKSAQKLEDIASRLRRGESVSPSEIGETLDYNQKLWTIFATDVSEPSHPMPQEIKNNIASLGLYVFKRTHEVRLNPDAQKMQILISINRNIAAGLMKQPPGMGVPSSAPQTRTDGGDPTDSFI